MTQASTTTRLRAAGAAVPPLPRPPPKRVTSRLRAVGAAFSCKKREVERWPSTTTAEAADVEDDEL